MKLRRSFVFATAVMLSQTLANDSEEKIFGRNFISTRVDMKRLAKQLLEPLYITFKAAVKHANDNQPNRMMKQEAQFGKCCKIGNIGAKAEITLFDFSLANLESLFDQMDMEAAPRNGNKGIMKVQSKGSDLRVMTGIAATIGMSALVPLNCEVRAKADIMMHKYKVDFEVDLGNDEDGSYNRGRGAKFQKTEINPGLMNVVMTPVFNGACEIIKGPVKRVFKEIAEKFTEAFQNVFAPFMRDFIIDLINNKMNFLIPGTLDFDLSPIQPGWKLSLVPSIDMVASKDLSTDIKTSFEMQATTSHPTWKNESSFRFSEYDKDYTTKLLPEPSLDHSFNLHLGAPALNNIISTVWYLGWGLISSDDPRVKKSSLCTNEISLDTDECPFPPAQLTLETFSSKFWLCFLLFPIKLFTKFDFQSVIPPPIIRFMDGGLGGSSELSVLLQGRAPLSWGGRRWNDPPTELIKFSASLHADATLPSFDLETGQITALGLDALYVDEIFVYFYQAPMLTALTSLVLNFVADVLETITTTILKITNDIVDEMLTRFASLLLPSIQAFPVASAIIGFYLPVAGMSAVGETSTNASYIEIHGDIGARAIFEEQDDDATLLKGPAVDPDSHCDTATLWSEQYGDNPNAVVGCQYDGREVVDYYRMYRAGEYDSAEVVRTADSNDLLREFHSEDVGRRLIQEHDEEITHRIITTTTTSPVFVEDDPPSLLLRGT